MFDKLVVSSTNRQRGRTVRFLAFTSLCYIGAITTALAASILAYDARMAGPATPTIRLTAPAMPMPIQDDLGPSHPGGGGTQSMRPVVNRPTLQGVDASKAPRLAAQSSGPPQIDGPSQIDPKGTGIGGPGAPGDGIGVGEIPTGTGTATPPKPKPQEEHRAVAPHAPVRVSSRVLQGKVITRITPPYPQIAKLAHISGTVTVEIIVSPEGVVESARAVD
ncbi:MAG TPA: energy transducer TonB, partial [Blastocatellia bacterium]